MVEIAPSILAANFSCLGREIETVRRAGVSTIHIDVMDGHFVPNITIGPPVVRSLREATDATLDCHLMIEKPDRYVPEFAAAGAGMISIHQEACRHLDRGLRLIQEHQVLAGVAINPATPVHALDEVLEIADFVLVMSVNPGFGGQKFLRSSLAKIRQLDSLRRQRGLSYRIEVDGGVTMENVAEIAAAGCDIVVAGASIFGAPDPAAAVEKMKRNAGQSQLLRA